MVATGPHDLCFQTTVCTHLSGNGELKKIITCNVQLFAERAFAAARYASSNIATHIVCYIGTAHLVCYICTAHVISSKETLANTLLSQSTSFSSALLSALVFNKGRASNSSRVLDNSAIFCRERHES